MLLQNTLKRRESKKEGRKKLEESDLSWAPPIVVIRSDTNTEEIIHPSKPLTNDTFSQGNYGNSGNEKRVKRLLDKLRPVSIIFSTSSNSSNKSKSKISSFQKLSGRLHRRQRTSEKVPDNLPDIDFITEQVEKSVEKKVNEIRTQWEKRATILAKKNEESRRRFSVPVQATGEESEINSLSIDVSGARGTRIEKDATTANRIIDNIQEAIRLHEAGELETSTMMFGRLAESQDENNTLSKLLYGLSLRHGWGCTPDPGKALSYLSDAASSAAKIEELALNSGKKKDGAASKGELVLAIYELANCFRHGWGIPIDEVAAKQYYETAANLGDTDAMNEVALCYTEGIGCQKNMFSAAKYYRMAEKEGNKILGNSWIWKEKYNSPSKVKFNI